MSSSTPKVVNCSAGIGGTVPSSVVAKKLSLMSPLMYQPTPVCVSRGWILAWVHGYSIQPIQRPEDPILRSDGLGGAFQSLGTGPTMLGGRTYSEVPARPTLWPLGRAHLKEMREEERRSEEGKLGTATVGLPLLRGSLPCNYNQDYFKIGRASCRERV